MELDNYLETGYHINDSDHQIEIVLVSKKPHVMIRIILAFLILLTSLIALTTVVASIYNKSFKVNVLVILGVLGVCAYYLTRILAWNQFGKETIIVTKDLVFYSAHYKWFKDTTFEFDRALLTVELLDKPVSKPENRKLSFSDGTTDLKLVTEKKEETMVKIKHQILHFNLDKE